MNRLLRLLRRKVKPLSVADATTGMALESNVQQARAALMTAEMQQRLFIENLHTRYGAPDGEWQLDDWAVGFVRGGHAKTD